MRETIDLTDRPRPPHIGLVFGTSTVVVLAMATSLAVNDRVPWPNAIRSAAVEYYTLAALGVPLWIVSERLSETTCRRSRLVAAHVCLGIGLVALWQGIHVLYARVAVGPDFWARVYADNWPYQLAQALFVYTTLLGFTLGFQASQRSRAQERRAADLRLQARDAELNAVRGQIKPHFLCNALTSVMALIEANPSEARRMTERLGDFLRGTFDRLDEDVITLDDELELLEAYFELEGLRFQSRLRVAMSVAPPAGTGLLPPFLLQPLVENAIKHGVAAQPDGGTVRILARVDRGRLHIAIHSPPRISRREGMREGRGLFLTNRRLEQAYGAAAFNLRFEDGAEEFVASLELPFQSHAA